ncbi:hypothetical protein CHS0354_023786 [Potamilus streckersoni]|uniref:Threonine synthase-like 2 n=1 Tax=Potamilus streckersoni TaxID=2493646 RepID=A0AAE0RYV1_9BIVA|nr:hypothetical protein CHS0354_023786 [Potamilus streckersoni]
MTLQQVSYEIARTLLQDEIPNNKLEEITYDTMNFDVPLVPLYLNTFVLELFHGPTLSFKDVGARFLALATSGDTGSAVGRGFFNIPGIEVILLYPKGKVSYIQEMQLTTIGNNISTLEVDGTFDDCQKLVKEAFTNSVLNKTVFLTSANSINIARLIPQSFYYFWAYKQLLDTKISVHADLVFSVPSGNFGNVTAGLIAKKMGLPVKRFIAATNSNQTFLKYFQTGIFEPKPSIKTISNAMDVGNPNNFPRITALYPDIELIRDVFWTVSISDFDTERIIKNTYADVQYILDPHTAVGLCGMNNYKASKLKSEFQNEEKTNDTVGVVLGTAHPAKFSDIISKFINHEIEIPNSLKQVLSEKKNATPIQNQFEELKTVILNKA